MLRLQNRAQKPQIMKTLSSSQDGMGQAMNADGTGPLGPVQCVILVLM